MSVFAFSASEYHDGTKKRRHRPLLIPICTDMPKGEREKRKTLERTPETSVRKKDGEREKRKLERTPTHTPTNGRTPDSSMRKVHQHHHDDTTEHDKHAGGGGIPHGLAYLVDDIAHTRSGHHHHGHGHRTPTGHSPAPSAPASRRGSFDGGGGVTPPHNRPHGHGQTMADIKSRIKAEAHAIEGVYHKIHADKGHTNWAKRQDELDRIHKEFAAPASDMEGGVLSLEEEKARRAAPPSRVGKPPPSEAHLRRRRKTVVGKALARAGFGRGDAPLQVIGVTQELLHAPECRPHHRLPPRSPSPFRAARPRPWRQGSD